jgi:hypothetical protein
MVLVILGLGFDPAAALRAAVLLSTPDVPPADTQFKARAIDCIGPWRAHDRRCGLRVRDRHGTFRKWVALRDIHVEIMTKARPLRMIFQSFVALIAPARLLREVRVFGWSGPKIRSVSARVCWCSGWHDDLRAILASANGR